MHGPGAETGALEGLLGRDVVDDDGDRRVADVGRNQAAEALLRRAALSRQECSCGRSRAQEQRR